jgi:hypothetical protein
MTDWTNKSNATEQQNDKPVEKRGFPPTPPPPAIDDLHFLVRESLQLGKRIISEIDRALRIMKE